MIQFSSFKEHPSLLYQFNEHHITIYITHYICTFQILTRVKVTLACSTAHVQGKDILTSLLAHVRWAIPEGYVKQVSDIILFLINDHDE